MNLNELHAEYGSLIIQSKIISQRIRETENKIAEVMNKERQEINKIEETLEEKKKEKDKK